MVDRSGNPFLSEEEAPGREPGVGRGLLYQLGEERSGRGTAGPALGAPRVRPTSSRGQAARAASEGGDRRSRVWGQVRLRHADRGKNSVKRSG